MDADIFITGDRVVSFNVYKAYYKSNKICEFEVGIVTNERLRYYKFNSKQLIKLFTKKVLLCKTKKVKHEWIEVLEKTADVKRRNRMLKSCKIEW